MTPGFLCDMPFSGVVHHGHQVFFRTGDEGRHDAVHPNPFAKGGDEVDLQALFLAQGQGLPGGFEEADPLQVGHLAEIPRVDLPRVFGPEDPGQGGISHDALAGCGHKYRHPQGSDRDHLLVELQRLAEVGDGLEVERIVAVLRILQQTHGQAGALQLPPEQEDLPLQRVGIGGLAGIRMRHAYPYSSNSVTKDSLW